MAKAPSNTNAPKRSFRSNQLILWLSVGFVALVILSLPSVVLIIFGMLPTIVAFIIDGSKKRNASFCVGGINFCGVFPYLMDLWAGANTMEMSARTLTDVFSLVIMYGAAGFGWMIYLTLPPVIAAFLSVMAQHKTSALRATQRRLIEEWGEDVSTSQEVLDMRDEIAAEQEKESADEDLNVEDFLDGIDSVLDSKAEQAVGTPKSAAGSNGKTDNGKTAPPARAAAASGG